MKYRKLRIAWSVAWGMLCLLLLVLWIRSYSQWDDFYGPSIGNHYSKIRSLRGQFSMTEVYDATYTKPTWTWDGYSNPRLGEEGMVWVRPRNSAMAMGYRMFDGPLGFGITANDLGERSIFMPHWFPAVLSLAVAAVPWFPWRFSLRTLLIAMTVAAVVLGIFVVSMR